MTIYIYIQGYIYIYIIFRFVSLLCLRSTLRLYIYIAGEFDKVDGEEQLSINTMSMGRRSILMENMNMIYMEAYGHAPTGMFWF